VLQAVQQAVSVFVAAAAGVYGSARMQKKYVSDLCLFLLEKKKKKQSILS
jgi:hypothetical protein